MKSIELCRANINDLSLLQHCDEQPHVLASDPNDDWGWETGLEKNPEWRERLIAELAGRPNGFTQIINPLLEERHCCGDVPLNLRAIDIWIGKASGLGKGYGTTMMKLALERCFAAPEVTAVIIDPLASNIEAHRFYERPDFKFVEPRSFGEDDCFVRRLDRADFWSQK